MAIDSTARIVVQDLMQNVYEVDGIKYVDEKSYRKQENTPQIRETSTTPQIGTTAKRVEIAELYHDEYTPARWWTGWVEVDGTILLLVTETGGKYGSQGRVLPLSNYRWVSQNGMSSQSKRGRMLIEGTKPIHLWTRQEKGDRFRFQGVHAYHSHSGDKPMVCQLRQI